MPFVGTFNEKSYLNFALTTHNTADALTTPTTLRYRLDCRTTGAALQGWTTLPASSSQSLAVSAQISAIQSDSNETEDKVLTVEANTGTTTQISDEFVWRVRNLSQVT